MFAAEFAVDVPLRAASTFDDRVDAGRSIALLKEHLASRLEDSRAPVVRRRALNWGGRGHRSLLRRFPLTRTVRYLTRPARSEERRVGKGWVSPGKLRCSPDL